MSDNKKQCCGNCALYAECCGYCPTTDAEYPADHEACQFYQEYDDDEE